MLEKILSVSGKPGLFQIISGNKRMIIAESLIDKKRAPVYSNDKVISLGDIAIYTTDEEVPLRVVMQNIQDKYQDKPIDVAVKTASEKELRDFMLSVLPNFDQDRVHLSDIKKLIQWYNLLLSNNLTDFSEPKAEENEKND